MYAPGGETPRKSLYNNHLAGPTPEPRKRTRNPRRVVLELLAGIKREAASAQNRWKVSSTVYVHTSEMRYSEREKRDMAYGVTTTRPRSADEYPENQSASWADLWVRMDDIVRTAEAARALALLEWQKINGFEYTLVRTDSERS